MPFTLQDATALWDKVQQDGKASCSISVLKGNMAMDLADYQSNEDLEKKLREIFQRADVPYPEKSHALHLKTTLLTALSRMDSK